MAKPKVFISYRRADLLAKGSVGSIRDALTKSFGAGNVFMDMHDVHPGQDFRAVLAQRVKSADVLLAILGPQWLEFIESRQDDPEDWVRLEIDTALRARVSVIPVLLGDTKMPRKERLPECLANLAYLHAPKLDPGGREFARQMTLLTKDVEREAKACTKKAPAGKFVVPSPGGAARKEIDASKRFPKSARKHLGGKAFALLGVVAWLGAVALFHMDAPERSRSPVVPKLIAQPTLPPSALPPLQTHSFRTIENTRTTVDPSPVVFEPFVNSLGMPFVRVPGTNVLFCVWETRVQDYAAYAEGNPGVGIKWKHAEFEGHEQAPDHPVVNVSWKDANAFCEWLSRKDGRQYRLPTDDEWSSAVGIGDPRGASPDSKDNHGQVENVYPWGGAWPPPNSSGNFSGRESAFASKIASYQDEFPFTAPVGSFSPNSLGLFDLGGNVSEWCEDVNNPTVQTDYLLRGGSWFNHEPVSLLSSARLAYETSFRYDGFGFRVVAVLRPPPN